MAQVSPAPAKPVTPPMAPHTKTEPTTTPTKAGSTASPTKAESTSVPKKDESSTPTPTSGSLVSQLTKAQSQKEPEAKPPLLKEQEDPVKEVDTTTGIAATGEALAPTTATVQQKAEIAQVDTSKADIITTVSTKDDTMAIRMDRPVTEKEETKPSTAIDVAAAVPVTEVMVRPSCLINEEVRTVPPETKPKPTPADEHVNEPEKVAEEEAVLPCTLNAEATKPLEQQVEVKLKQDEMQPGMDLVPDTVTVSGKEVAEKDIADQQPAVSDITVVNVRISPLHKNVKLFHSLSLPTCSLSPVLSPYLNKCVISN